VASGRGKSAVTKKKKIPKNEYEEGGVRRAIRRSREKLGWGEVGKKILETINMFQGERAFETEPRPSTDWKRTRGQQLRGGRSSYMGAFFGWEGGASWKPIGSGQRPRSVAGKG